VPKFETNSSHPKCKPWSYDKWAELSLVNRRHYLGGRGDVLESSRAAYFTPPFSRVLAPPLGALSTHACTCADKSHHVVVSIVPTPV
jgi:hypothetical protein